ncbi:MAG: hypothetical protein DBX39_06575 [Bacillota bacterium]|nr:MAG: hypothetical protein DBX39_06575 [Bacillota bacterium]
MHLLSSSASLSGIISSSFFAFSPERKLSPISFIYILYTFFPHSYCFLRIKISTCKYLNALN